MNKRLLSGLALMLFVGLPGCGSESAEPVEVIESLYAAFRAGDVDGAVALFAEDAEITDPFGTFRGRSGAEDWVREGLRFYEGVEVFNFITDGTVVTWDETFFTVDGDTFHNTWRATVEDGEIARIKLTSAE